MSTLELENIKHPDNSGDNIALASNGNVGIGTGSPSDRLHIQKSNDTGIIIENTTGATLSLLSTGAGRVRSSGTLIFDTGGATERMRVGSNGYVGIGETSPDRYLHVKSGATNVVAKFESTDGIAAVEFTDNAGSAEVGTNAGAVVFYPSGVEKARISTQGYLTTPNQPAFIVEGTDEWSYGASHASTQADISYHSPWPIKSNATLTHNVGSHAVLNTHPESSGFKYLKFTAPVSGFYEFGFQANFKIMNDGDYHAMGIKVNTTGTGSSGNPDYYFFQAQRSGISDQNQFSGNGTCLVYLNINDYAVCYSRSPEYIVVAANRWHLYGRLVG